MLLPGLLACGERSQSLLSADLGGFWGILCSRCLCVESLCLPLFCAWCRGCCCGLPLEVMDSEPQAVKDGDCRT